MLHYFCFSYRIVSHLGSGQFGSVSEAEWRNGRRQTTVAVKTLTDSANTVMFLQEAAIMAQFKHPNILTLHGVVSAGHPVSCDCNSQSFTILLFGITENDGHGTHAQWKPEGLCFETETRVKLFDYTVMEKYYVDFSHQSR